MINVNVVLEYLLSVIRAMIKNMGTQNVLLVTQFQEDIVRLALLLLIVLNVKPNIFLMEFNSANFAVIKCLLVKLVPIQLIVFLVSQVIF